MRSGLNSELCVVAGAVVVRVDQCSASVADGQDFSVGVLYWVEFFFFGDQEIQ